MNKRLKHYANGKYFKVADIFIFAILLIALVISLVFIFLPQKGEFVEIYHLGKLVKKISLTEDTVFEIAEVTIQIKDGEVCVAKSSCPDQLCVKNSHIKKEGESIICLPNQVIVKISGEKEIDGVTQ